VTYNDKTDGNLPPGGDTSEHGDDYDDDTDDASDDGCRVKQ